MDATPLNLAKPDVPVELIEVRPRKLGVIVKRGDETLIGKCVSIVSGKASTLTCTLEPARKGSQDGPEEPAASVASTAEPKVRRGRPADVPAGKSPAQHPDDCLQAGTIWKGLSSYSYPAYYLKDIPRELAITKRTGNSIEAVYKGDRGRVACFV